jgi:hypothetical protein
MATRTHAHALVQIWTLGAAHARRVPHPAGPLRKERHGYDIRLKRTSAAGAREGIFGPRSLMWRISREAAVSLAAGRALLLQLFLE